MEDILKEYEPILDSLSDVKEKIRLLNSLSEEQERKKPLHSLALSEKAYHLACLEKDEEGIVNSLLHLGRSLWLTGDLEKALDVLLNGLYQARDLNILELEVEFLNALGNVNLYLKIYDRALEYYRHALNLAKAIKYEKLIGAILNNIGEIYLRLADYTMALQFYEESLEKFEKVAEEFLKAVPLLNLGAVYYALDKYKQSEEYVWKSLKISKNVKDYFGENGSLHLLGKLAYKQGKLDEATLLFEKCLRINQEVGDVFSEVELYIDYYYVQKDKLQWDKAIEFLQLGLEKAEKIKAKDFIIQICSLLGNSFEELNDFQKSHFYYKKYHDQTVASNKAEQESKLRSIAIQLKAEKFQRENKAFQLLTDQLEAKTKELSRSYSQMKIVSEIGQSITSSLNIRQVFSRIYDSVNSLMDANVLGIGLHNPKNNTIEYKLFIEDGVNASPFEIPLSSKTSWAVWCFLNEKEVLVNDVDKEYSQYLDSVKSTYGAINPSIIFCPLFLNDEIIGVITVQSKYKHAYTQNNLDSIRALASYIAIAINNAHKSEKLAIEINTRKTTQLELESINKKLTKLSQIDGLTGIYNRRYFEQFFYDEWERHKRYEFPLSVILIDVDQFKEYNDHYGHQDGDCALVDVAKGLQQVLKRKTDIIARYGGDEFVVVLPNTDEAGAIKVSKEMLNKINSFQIPHDYSSVASYITVTVGAATIIPNNSLDSETLLRNADKALYRAKETGRNNFNHCNLNN